MNENIRRIIKRTKCFLLDLDGTVYVGEKLIGDMKKTLCAIRRSGRKIIYLTNNSSKSRADYEIKLKNLGIYEKSDGVYTSGNALCDYLNRNGREKEGVYVLGTNSLKKEMEERGIVLDERSPHTVAIAYDTQLTYGKLCAAARFIRNGAKYIATHPDINCPSEEGPLPDVGSFIKLIEASVGRTPEIIIGKPETLMGEMILKNTGLDANSVTMVGDRLNTDIMFGRNCGFNTLLVLSGETDALAAQRSEVSADAALATLNDCVQYL